MTPQRRQSGAISAMPLPDDLAGEEFGPSSLTKPTAWAALIDRLGFPIVAFGAVLSICVWLYGSERQERAVVRAAFADQVDKLVKAQRDDRDALIRALEKQTATLEQIKDSLRSSRDRISHGR